MQNKEKLNGTLGKKWGVYGTTPPNAYAVKTNSKDAGIEYLLGRMNLRKATNAEVTRAREATTPEYQINLARNSNLPNGNPQKINEFTIETDRTGTLSYPTGLGTVMMKPEFLRIMALA